MFELAHIAFILSGLALQNGAIKASKKKLSGKVNQDIVDPGVGEEATRGVGQQWMKLI